MMQQRHWSIIGYVRLSDTVLLAAALPLAVKRIMRPPALECRKLSWLRKAIEQLFTAFS